VRECILGGVARAGVLAVANLFEVDGVGVASCFRRAIGDDRLGVVVAGAMD